MAMQEGETRAGVTVESLGHWHPDGIHLLAKHRDVYVWEIDFEQKYPRLGWAQHGPGEGECGISVESRGEGESLYFREGEDGSKGTTFTFKLPTRYEFRWRGGRLRWSERFWLLTSDEGKYSIYVTAVSI
jgi:hypothetical protein